MKYPNTLKGCMFLACAMVMFVAGCGEGQEGPAEQAGKTIDQAIEKTTDSVSEAMDSTGAAINEAAENAGEAVSEALESTGDAIQEAAEGAGEALNDTTTKTGE